MFLVIHSKGVTSVAGYSAALNTAQEIANESGEKARVYRMPHVVEFVACPRKEPVLESPAPAKKKAKRK